MPNERLRSAIASSDLTLTDMAIRVGVDPKTVERWITQGRVPHRGHRWATATALGTDEVYLWPELVDDVRTKSASVAEFVSLYPHRGAMPHELWQRLVAQARDQIDILVFSGLFLTDGTPELPDHLAAKAQSGTKVRLLFGDPCSQAVELRGLEEGIGDGLAARIRISLAYLKTATDTPGVQLRQHSATLYNSIYRFDEDLLVNTHVYGAPAAQSPLLHLRRVPGGRLFGHYIESFERVWETAT